mmetsp:Transcript_51996/g.137347  ORF Transcript_51996/g.137347 Transcript_51996/m.137347 type:complete len:597 (-) Transcript_51996:230-2020(-)
MSRGGHQGFTGNIWGSFLYGNTGAGDDDEEGLLEDEKDHDKAMLNLFASPSPIERVTQLACGGEHGILLTDAGKVYTFGDNRYGQLGRDACAKVEGRAPYVVPDMLTFEAKMVAAGVHHNLVLVTPGVVWSWGRNKGGQLGCGDLKDRTTPVKVQRQDQEENIHLGRWDSDEKPEDREGWRIVTIGAGLFSSVAAAYNSDVWHWGQIADKFFQRKKEKVRYGQPVTYVQTDKAVVVRTPSRIFERTSFKKSFNKTVPAPISETGCRVLGSGGPGKSKKEAAERMVRIKELTLAAQTLQLTIQNERAKLDMQDTSKTVSTSKEAEKEESPLSLLTELTDTINRMERDLVNLRHEISTQENKLSSCDLQQEHTQKQLHTLDLQAARLSEDVDRMSVQILNCPKRSPEKKKLEEREQDIKMFMESNKTTKMALLDQRGDMDKDKQRITRELKKHHEQQEEISKRLVVMRTMLSAVTSASGNRDSWIRLLKDRVDDFRHHFDERPEADDVHTFLWEHEADTKFLNATEMNLMEQVKSVPDSDTAKKDRTAKVTALLFDIIELRRSWNDMLRESWLEEELDIEEFFLKPQPRSNIRQQAQS